MSIPCSNCFQLFLLMKPDDYQLSDYIYETLMNTTTMYIPYQHRQSLYLCTMQNMWIQNLKYLVKLLRLQLRKSCVAWYLHCYSKWGPKYEKAIPNQVCTYTIILGHLRPAFLQRGS